MLERIVRGWRRIDAQGELPDAAARHERRGLQVYPDEDGMLVVRGRLEPEVGAMLIRALALVAEAALAQGLDPAPGQERYQVVVHDQLLPDQHSKKRLRPD